MKKEKFFFDDIFEDWTKLGKKILKSKYLVDGKYPVIDQGKNKIAGFINEEKKLFLEIPVIIFGDHTRILKFIDFPFFLGADGVKILKNKRKNFLDKYLYYALKYFKIPDTGYNRHFKWLKDFFVIDLEIEKQEKVIGVLDEIQKILKSKKEQLSEFEKLSKCLFFEMFGDPILNEKKWNIFNFSQVCEINPSKSELENIDNNTEVSFIPMSSVSTKGEVLTKEIKRFEEVKIGFTYFKEKDVLFAKITPCMENGKGGIAKNLKNGIGFGSTEFHVLRPKDKVSNSYWVYYISMLPFFRKNAEKIMTGSGGQKRVPISYFKNVIIGLPPIELQNKFAERIKLIEKSKFILSEILKLQSECIFLKQI